MENATKPSYPSKKPLGKLYHHLRSRACELTLSNTRSIGEEIEADKRYLSEGRFGYMERALVTYESYCRDVTMIMVRFELKSGERAKHSIYILNVQNDLELSLPSTQQRKSHSITPSSPQRSS
jgi:hypothetical protein